MKNKDILLKLLDLKETEIIHDNFNFEGFNLGNKQNKTFKGKVFNHCGTSGCLAGQLPLFTDNFSFLNDDSNSLAYFIQGEERKINTMSALQHFFDLEEKVINSLFLPYDWEEEYVDNFYCEDEATLEEVVENGKKLMNTYPELFE